MSPAIKAPPLQVRIAVAGPRRIGKTYILNKITNMLKNEGYIIDQPTKTEHVGYWEECMFVYLPTKGEIKMEKLPISPTKAAEEVVKQASDQYNKGDFDTWSYEVLKNIEKEKEERRS